jgi:hypothetical protein
VKEDHATNNTIHDKEMRRTDVNKKKRFPALTFESLLWNKDTKPNPS